MSDLSLTVVDVLENTGEFRVLIYEEGGATSRCYLSKDKINPF